MKRTIKLLSALTVLMLVMMTALPALASTLTVNYKQDDSKVEEERFDFTKDRIQLSAYLIAEGSERKILSVFEDIQIFDQKGGFLRTCISELKKRIKEKGIKPVATIWTRSSGKYNGRAVFNVAVDGMYLVVQSGSQTDGTVQTSEMMLATNGRADTTTAKWKYTAPPTKPDEPEPDDKPHKLTIYYIYWDGRTAFPTYEEEDLWPGTHYHVPSPQLPQYDCSLELVDGVMPNHDMVYWVVYTPKRKGKHKVPLEDYDTPLGLGNIQMHVGVCFE